MPASERTYEAETRAHPTADSWNKLGLTRHLQNKYDAAIPAFREAIQLQPGLWTAHLFLGIDLYRTNQFQPALLSLQQADRMAPTNGQGRDEVDYWLGATLIALKQPLAGLRSLEQLLKRNPEHPAALELTAQTYSDQSSALWNDVAERSFETAPGYEIHGHALEAEGNTTGAMEAYRQAQAMAPQRPGPGREIGRLLLTQGKAEEALAELEKERKLAPSDSGTCYYYGLAAIQLSRWDDAVPCLEMAMGGNPVNAEPAMALAQVHLARKQPVEACKAAAKAVGIAPRSQAPHDLLVAALQAAGDTAGVDKEQARWRGR